MKTKGIIRNQKGFTLIELMVVAVILAIISAIAVPIYNGYRQEAQAQEAYMTLAQVADLCIGKAIKNIETGNDSAITLAQPTDGQYFTYDDPGDTACTTDGGTFTATGNTGAVDGLDLTVTVSFSGSPATIPAKEWGGALY